MKQFKNIILPVVTHFSAILTTVFVMGSLSKYNQVVMGAVLLWILVGGIAACCVGYGIHLVVSRFGKATAKRNQEHTDNIKNRFYHD